MSSSPVFLKAGAPVRRCWISNALRAKLLHVRRGDDDALACGLPIARYSAVNVPSDYRGWMCPDCYAYAVRQARR